MQYRVSLVAAAALLASSLAAHAATLAYQTIDNPGDPTFNQLLGINNAGTISAYYGSGAAGHPNQGYTTAAPYSTFTAENVPGSVQTQVTGINHAGATTGFWSNTNTGMDANFGFIRLAGKGSQTYLAVSNPLVSSNPPVNQVLGINDSEIAVGFYNDSTGASHGYTYTVGTGQFTPVTMTGAVSSAAAGINNHNLICGFLVNPAGRTIGFLKSGSAGSELRFGVPGASVTQLLGVNNSGEAAGFYVGADALPHGVIYHASTGKYETVNDPQGAQGTALNGLNDKGQFVGFYTDASGIVHGMLVTESK